MRSFHHPAPGFETRLCLFGVRFLTALFDVWYVVTGLDGGQRGLPLVASVRAEVLRLLGGGLGPGDDHPVEGGRQQDPIIDVGRAADDRERDATPVGEHTALASFFFPDPLD